jgi:hypothetical protein
MANIDRVKQVGVFQSTFMFWVTLPSIPGAGTNQFTFSVRSTTIPVLNKSKNIVRFNNDQFTLQGGKEHDAEWSTTILGTESFLDYNNIVKWLKYCEAHASNPELYKTDAYVKLLSIDEITVTKRFKIIGIYPLSVPAIEDLNQDNTDTFINLDCNFAYDTIDRDENMAFTF